MRTLNKYSALFIFLFLCTSGAIAQDYSLVAKDASWCWYSDPRAIYHAGKVQQVYFAYVNSKGDVMISARNQKTKTVSNFVLHEKLQIDDHNVPSILFLPDGKLLTFYTEHNGRFFMRKSKYAEDISAWEAERVIPFGGKKITYSHPVMLKGENNRIFMFWRGSDWRPTLSFSDDLGETWSKSIPLIENKNTNNRPYLKVCSDNKNRIDFAFTDGHPTSEPTNSLYHIYYQNGSFYQTDGKLIKTLSQLPIAPKEVNKVYDATASKIRAWISDIALDQNNRPIMVYTRYPLENDHRYHYAKWNGKQWQDEELTKGGPSMCVVPEGVKNTEPFYSGGISLDHNDPSNVYLAKKDGPFFELEHWKKKGKKWGSEQLTSNSKENNYRPVVAGKYPGKKPIVLWMTGHYQHYTKFDTDLRINVLAASK
ncbi:MAG: BNR-4 repeat-containing protein [Pedobacter sp.]|nr:BNR-4 repeat-containing protein [Pedobacter sp.]MDQ8052227.1 BNR-4 repeat-containing protein [Pedobacter sp.]